MERKNRQFAYYPIVLPIASGIALLLAYPPFSMTILAWIALIPMGLIAHCPPRQTWLGAALGGAVFHLAVLNCLRTWTSGATTIFGSSGDWLWLWVVFSVLGSAGWTIRLMLTQRLVLIGRWPVSFALPVVWTSADFISTFVARPILGVPVPGMLQLSVTQADWTSLIQIVDFGGAYALTFLVAAANGAAVDLIRLWRNNEDRRAGTLGAAAFVGLLVLATLAYGRFRLAEYSPTSGPLVAIVTGDSTRFGQFPSAIRQAKRGKNVDQDAQPDVLLMGEYWLGFNWSITVPDSFELTAEAARQVGVDRNSIPAKTSGFGALERLSAGLGIPVVCSAAMTIRQGTHEKSYRMKSLAYFTPSEGLVQLYHKINLAPEEIMPNTLQRLFRIGHTPHLHGTILPVFSIDARSTGRVHRAAPGICYDSWLSSYFQKAMTEPSPECFLIASHEGDDATGNLGRFAYCLNKLRAVEARRSTAQNVIGGISCVLDSCGRVVIEGTEAPEGPPLVLLGGLPVDNRVSPYTRWGDSFSWFVFGLMLVGGVWTFFLRGENFVSNRLTNG